LQRKSGALNLKKGIAYRVGRDRTSNTEGNRLTKLGDIFVYRDSTDDVICQLSREARTFGDFSTRKPVQIMF